MVRLISPMLYLMLFLTACTSINNGGEEDGFPEFSEEQLQEMIKNHPPAAAGGMQEVSTTQLIQKVEAMLAKNPKDVDNSYTLAKLYYQKYSKDSLATDCQKSIALFSNVIALEANYEKGHAYYNRMLCYYYSQDYEKAWADMEQFIAVNKDRTKVNYPFMQASILFEQGDKTKACAYYQEALTMAAKDSLPIENEQIWKERCAN